MIRWIMIGSLARGICGGSSFDLIHRKRTAPYRLALDAGLVRGVLADNRRSFAMCVLIKNKEKMEVARRVKSLIDSLDAETRFYLSDSFSFLEYGDDWHSDIFEAIDFRSFETKDGDAEVHTLHLGLSLAPVEVKVTFQRPDKSFCIDPYEWEVKEVIIQED
jgi:hypothetical protein